MREVRIIRAFKFMRLQRKICLSLFLAMAIVFSIHLLLTNDCALLWNKLVRFSGLEKWTWHRQTVLVLMWTTYFGNQFNNSVFDTCPELNCQLVFNKSLLKKSRAVVFHDRDMDVNDLPKERYKNQHFVFFLIESPYHVGGAFRHLSRHFYSLTMNYKRDADIKLPFGFFTPRSEKRSAEFWRQLKSKVQGRTKTAVVFVSNCNTPSRREFYYKELKKHIDLDMYGNCGTLSCPTSNQSCFTNLLVNNYFFHLSFENSNCVDYATEKYFDRLNNWVVPVVMSRQIYSAVGPNDSFIAADDFKNVQELANHLKYLTSNIDAYMQYFQWMDKWDVVGEEGRFGSGFCNLCRHLRNEQTYLPLKPSYSADNLDVWYGKKENCINGYAQALMG